MDAQMDSQTWKLKQYLDTMYDIMKTMTLSVAQLGRDDLAGDFNIACERMLFSTDSENQC